MAEVRVRKLEDWVVDWFRTQARRHGESLEGELRQVLTDVAQERKRAVAAGLRADLEALRKQYGTFSDSTALIREDRDARG
jgi:plasmid stability protein